MSGMKVALSLENIREASLSIDPVFLRSPQLVSAELSDRLGRETVIKIETFNPIKSFKGRGADYFMRQVPSGRTVVCASAGNFGQAIAYAGGARGVSVRVFAATTANTAKVARMRELGAQVVLEGPDFDAAKSAARDYVHLRPECLFVEDGHDARISEGAGTIAVELDRMPMDVLLVPVGNGALISGIGRWMKARNPQTKIIGICAQGAPAMALSWREGRPVSSQTTATMADGLAVRVPVPAAVDWMREYVDDMMLVSEESIWRALEVVRDTLGLLVEPPARQGSPRHSSMAVTVRLSGRSSQVATSPQNCSPASPETRRSGTPIEDTARRGAVTMAVLARLRRSTPRCGRPRWPRSSSLSQVLHVSSRARPTYKASDTGPLRPACLLATINARYAPVPAHQPVPVM